MTMKNLLLLVLISIIVSANSRYESIISPHTSDCVPDLRVNKPEKHRYKSTFLSNITCKPLKNKTPNNSIYLEKLDSAITIGKMKIENIFNNQGKVTQQIFSRWDSGQWIYDYKTEFSYQNNGKIKIYTKVAWAVNHWENREKIEYQYNTSGDILKINQYSFWDVWENRIKFEYIYTPYANFDSLLVSDWKTNQWESYLKNENTYNLSNKVIKIDLYAWDHDRWNNIYKYDFTYDMNRNLTQLLQVDWSSGVGENSLKYNYSFNDDQNTTSYNKYFWAPNSNQWKNEDKIAYEYDSNKNMISYTHYEWKGDKWNGMEKCSLSYNNASKYEDIAFPEEYSPPSQFPKILEWYGTYSYRLDSGIVYSWDTTINNWDSGTKEYYYYSPFTIPIISGNPSKNLKKSMPITVKTNSTGSVLFITNKNKYTSSIEIYSANGKMVKKVNVTGKNETLNISQLSAGTYWIILTDNYSTSFVTSFIKWQ